MQTPHPDFSNFFHRLGNSKWFTAWAGNVVRQSAPRWLSQPYRFTGAGAVMTGGRWNNQRLIPAVYASSNPDTLHAEAYYKARRYGWTADDLKARMLIGMRWELQAVMDLTVPDVRRVLGIRKTDLIGCDWEAEQLNGREPLTQAIARAAFERMAEGLLVPSARDPNGVNVVYFPSHRRENTVLQPLDETNIPFLHGL